jgi:hypothetical protein
MISSSLIVLSFALTQISALRKTTSTTPNDEDSSSINFCAIGDWGGQEFFPYFTHAQKETAKGMGKVAADIKSKFVIALGDNFYHTGVEKADSYRFNWSFENVYSAKSLTDIPWYVIGGNHDHYGNITAQIEYSTNQEPNGRWKFPSLYHSHSFQSADGSVTLDLILIDTVDLCGINEVHNHNEPGYFDPLPLLEKHIAQDQWDWIEHKMNASTADYLLVGGHYPVYSVCSHGPTASLIEHLRPMLAHYGAHYLSGHDHCMVHFEEDSVHHVLTGAGDECCYEATNLNNVTYNKGELKWFLSKENKDLYQTIGGFSSFQAGTSSLQIKYHDHRGNAIFNANPIFPRNNAD